MTQFAFGSSGTGARLGRGLPGPSAMTQGVLGSQVHGCGGTGPRGLREVTPDAAPGTQLGKGGPHRWLARCHSFCHDRMDTSYEVICGLLGKRPQDQIKLIFA